MMCNACGFFCCASDEFEGCGCEHCPCPECWDDEECADCGEELEWCMCEDDWDEDDEEEPDWDDAAQELTYDFRGDKDPPNHLETLNFYADHPGSLRSELDAGNCNEVFELGYALAKWIEEQNRNRHLCDKMFTD